MRPTHRDLARLLVGAHVDVEEVWVEVEGVVLLVDLGGRQAEPDVAAAAPGQVLGHADAPHQVAALRLPRDLRRVPEQVAAAALRQLNAVGKKGNLCEAFRLLGPSG